MPGLLKIALQLLVNDRQKFFTLVVGVTFAVFLMMQMTSTFAGLMRRTSANIINIGAKIWVMDPSLVSEKDQIPLPDYVLDAVRSIKGVKYAVPIYLGGGLAKLSNGAYQAVSIVGLDDVTLFGRPKLVEGSIESIYNDDAFIVAKDVEYEKLGSPSIGTVFEVNQHRAVITGFAELATAGLFGSPTLYTTYSRAIFDLPGSRFKTTYILVEPQSDEGIAWIQNEVAKLGYRALTQEQFIKCNTDYYTYKTGMGINIMMMTLISFIVGLSLAGQTFYTFVVENLDKFAALKAIGAKRLELIEMILFQASVVGFLGYGLGVFLSCVLTALAKLRLPTFAAMVTLGNLSFSFVAVIIIVAFASYLGIRRVIKIEPYDVFRG